MSKALPSSRPASRRARSDVPIDQETIDKALRKADGQTKRLRAVVRVFLDLWGRGVIDIPESKIDWQEQRAEKRRRVIPGANERQ